MRPMLQSLLIAALSRAVSLLIAALRHASRK